MYLNRSFLFCFWMFLERKEKKERKKKINRKYLINNFSFLLSNFIFFFQLYFSLSLYISISRVRVYVYWENQRDARFSFHFSSLHFPLLLFHSFNHVFVFVLFSLFFFLYSTILRTDKIIGIFLRHATTSSSTIYH